MAETWNGVTWTVRATARQAVSGSLAGVSCAWPRSCVAVGGRISHLAGSQVTLAERWNGLNWAIHRTPGNPAGAEGNDLTAVSCTSASACTAVGSAGPGTLAARWDGRTWFIEKTPIPAAAMLSRLAGVSCTSATACTAVGYYQDRNLAQFPLAERWDGKTWSTQQIPPTAGGFSGLTRVSCGSATACVAVGNAASPLTERWDGTAWTGQPTAAGVTSLSDVSCASAAACVAVGNSETGPVAERWDGTIWILQALPDGSGASSVSCASARACTAVSTTDSALRWDGTTWSKQPLAPATGHLSAVSCASARACTAVGDQLVANLGVVLLAEHWNGRNWAIQRIPSPRGSQNSPSLAGVSCAAARACLAVGPSLVERYS
jgi:hypothetical protein